MNKTPDNSGPERARILEQAAEHLAAMKGRRVSAGDRKAFQEWLSADPRHADAYAKVEMLWTSAAELPSLKKRKPRKITRRDAGKVAVALIVGAGAWRYLASHPFADYRTATAESRKIELPDGSTVELAPQTVFSVQHTPVARHSVLHAGQAYFSVAKDAARPFTVEAGKGRVTALGTAFGVEHWSDSVNVVVTEHEVAVEVAYQKARVLAGSQVAYDDRKVGAVETADPAIDLGWREGRLVFTSAAFGDVVTALNRWRSGQIVILDPSLSTEHIALIIDVKRSDAILNQLERALPIRLLNVTPYLTFVLRAK